MRLRGRTADWSPLMFWAAGFASGHGVNVVMRSWSVKPKPLSTLKVAAKYLCKLF